MGRKKKNTTNASSNLTTLKIGSRIRCTDDGVQGRIVWANGVAVKVKWDDGEKVTWKRDSLATRPIELLDADGEDDQAPAPAATDIAAGITSATETEQAAAPVNTAAIEPTSTTEQAQEATATAPEPTVTTETPQAEPEITPALTEQPQAESGTTPTEPTATAPEPTATQPTSAPTAPAPELTLTEQATTEQVTSATEPTAEQTGSSTEPEQTAAKPQRQPKTPAEPKEKKLSALDAAAKVLAEAGQAMNAQEMIQAMADKGYWTSPGGKTPAATIYAAILNEIKKKGGDARFVKSARGKFARKA